MCKLVVVTLKTCVLFLIAGGGYIIILVQFARFYVLVEVALLCSYGGG